MCTHYQVTLQKVNYSGEVATYSKLPIAQYVIMQIMFEHAALTKFGR